MASGNSPRIYSISTETSTGAFNSDTLACEIKESNIATPLARLRSGEGTLEIYGETPWTQSDITALDALVLAHSGEELNRREASATEDTQTTATEDVLMAGMTITPGAGSYYARFSTSVENSKANAKTYVSLYVAGVQLQHTQRHSRRGGAQGDVQDIIATHALIKNLAEGETVEVRWKVSTGTAIAHERTLLLEDA